MCRLVFEGGLANLYGVCVGGLGFVALTPVDEVDEVAPIKKKNPYGVEGRFIRM